jgi:replicative DNA helicase
MTTSLAAKLSPADFAQPVHQEIFAAIKAVLGQNQIPTATVLRPLLAEVKVTDTLSAAAYLGRLISVAVPATVAGSYVKAIKSMSARRQLAGIGDDAAMMARNPASDLFDGAGVLVDHLDTLRSTLRERRASLSSLKDATVQTLAHLGEKKSGIRTGLLDLDHVLGGWHRRELAILAGRPSMGKSAFLFSSVLAGAKRGTNSLIFSKEMPTDAVTYRMLSDMVWNSQTPIPYVRAMQGELTEYEIQRLRAVGEELKPLPIHIDDQPGLTVSEICARTKRHMERLDSAGQRLDLVVVDHLGKVKASDRYAGNKVHEMGEKSNALAEMAKELDIAVVCAHQLNRGVEGRENKRPTLADLRDSGNIEEDAEAVMLVYRHSYYLERQREDGLAKEDDRKAQLAECQNDLELIIAKNRNGPCRTIDLFIDLPSNVVRDMAR